MAVGTRTSSRDDLLFHHDSVPSGGVNCLRSLKVCELSYNADGTIVTVDGRDDY